MLNPIFPNATGGGTDPELEGRVDALESDFGELKTTVESNAEFVVEYVNETEVFKESVSLPFVGFSTSYLYGQAGNFLNWQTPLSRFNTALGTVVFTANDVECSFEVEENDTVNDVVNKFADAANTAGYYAYPQIFSGNLRFEASSGWKLSFPRTNWPALWSVLGLSGQSIFSTAIEDLYSLAPYKILLQNSGGENLDNRFQRLENELGMLDYASGKLAAVDLLQDPQVGQTAYIYSASPNYFSGTEDFSGYLYPTDTMEMTVNGDPITVVAGSDLSFWGLFNVISNALPSPLLLEFFGGQLRIKVEGNTSVQILDGKIAQLFGFMNSVVTTVEAEQLPYGFRATEILHDLNRTYPLSVDATLERMSAEIYNLQNGINHLLREVAELKSGGA